MSAAVLELNLRDLHASDTYINHEFALVSMIASFDNTTTTTTTNTQTPFLSKTSRVTIH